MTVNAVPRFFADDYGECRIENEAEIGGLVGFQVFSDVKVGALFVAADQQPNGVCAGSAAVAQCCHGEQRLHESTLVIGGATSVDDTVLLDSREWWNVAIPIHSQAERRRARRGRAQVHWQGRGVRPQ